MWPEGLARPTTANIKVFTPGSTSHWQTWNKPVGCTFVYILACGGGGAGGKGAGGNATTSGGGGGSGLLQRAIFPAFILPDTLYFRIGNGGAPTTVSQTTGNSGTETVVSIAIDSPAVASNILMRCQGGTGGGGAATSTAGAGGATVTALNQSLSALGFWQQSSRAGTAGGATNSSGGNLTVQGGGLIVMGGTGGGNGTGSGGNITVITEFKTWVAMSGGAFQTNGQSAIKNTSMLFNALTTNQPIVFQGGTGGGGTNVVPTPSGAGGAGSWGCGGGGGGNSRIASGVAGNGGAGGDGFAIVIAF